jgi:hypothetical protein
MVAAAVRKMWEPSVGEDDEESRQGEVRVLEEEQQQQESKF